MNDQILNKDIVISSMELKGGKIAIKDQDGNKYGFWMKKQDGQDTQAYAQWLTMNLTMGSTVSVGYKEEPDSFTNEQGKVVNYTKRSVIGFRETNATPVATQAKPQYKPNGKKEEPDWNAIAVGKTASLFLQALISSGKTPEEVEKQIPQVYALAEKVVNWEAAPKAVIHVEETPREHELYGAPTVTESDIPF